MWWDFGVRSGNLVALVFFAWIVGGGGNPGGEGVRGDGFGEIGVGGREKMREEEGEGQEIEQKCKCRL